jgi:sigma-B regulation protein RsbU (phosphoserine phosphatase)
MTMLSTQQTDWIHGICRRFHSATGWPLSYAEIPPGRATEAESVLASKTGCCWREEIRDGVATRGFLQIDLPDKPEGDRSFLMVSEFAELVAHLVNTSIASSFELERRTEEVSTLVDMGRSAPSDGGLVGSVKQLLRVAVQLTGYRAAAFFLLNPSTQTLSLRVVHGLEVEHVTSPIRELTVDCPDWQALTEGRLELCGNGEFDSALWLPGGISAGACVAVRSEAGAIGTLWTFDRRHRTSADREIHVLESIAAQIASVLEREVLLKESAEQHRLQSDLAVASACQVNDLLRRVPDGIGFDVAAACTSRFEVGGDLCELIPLNDHRTIIAVGDALGDSVPAALIMSAVRGSLRSLAGDLLQGGEKMATDRLMASINDVLGEITPPHQFMSLFVGVIDTRSASLTYTNGGHPTPILIRNGETSTLESHGMLLGVLPDVRYESATIELAADDLLILFSDGVSEAMNRRQRLFRSDGIIDAVLDRRHASASEVLQAIWDTLESHLQGGSEPDDRTLLVVKMPS